MAFLEVSLILLAFDAAAARSEIFKAIQGCENNFKLPIAPFTTSTASSEMECAADCLKTSDCDSVNVCWDSNILTCEILDMTSEITCGDLQVESGCSFYKKGRPTCQNGGTYNESWESCDCVFGFTGDWCERYYYDCSEAYDKTQQNLGTIALRIQPSTSPHSFTVTCHLQGGGWTYITRQLSSDPQLDFNKSWEEMKHPFGDPLGNYWPGLENIHYLTTQRNYILDFYLIKTDIGWIGSHSDYTQFRLGDEASGYKFQYNAHYDRVDGLDDGFGIDGVNGPKDRPYATYDHPDPNNCVVSQGVSWWYGQACPNYNLHLPLYDRFAPVFITWPVAGNTGTWDVREWMAQLIPNWVD